jgi:hypothetical protein
MWALDACIDRTRPSVNKHLSPNVVREFAETVAASIA